jgi:hypothetical protein
VIPASSLGGPSVNSQRRSPVIDTTCMARSSVLLLLCHIVLIVALIAPSRAADRVTVAPAIDDAVVLHNPDMGWVVYENFPVDPNPAGSSTMLGLPKENFDGVDHVAIMFTWADIERGESGVFDFRDVDHAYDYWRSRGKQIQLRISTESLLWWSRTEPPRGLGVPRQVLEKIPAAHKQRRSAYGFEYDLVDARDEIYLGALDRFLAAVASISRPTGPSRSSISAALACGASGTADTNTLTSQHAARA